MNKHAKQQPLRRSAVEWRRIIERWERSAQSADTFAGKHGLSKRTLIWWRWRLRGHASSSERTAPQAELTFIPLATTSARRSKPSAAETRWAISTPAGVRVEMSGSSALVTEGLRMALERVHERS